MPRFARIFFISLVSAAGSCSSEQLAQKAGGKEGHPSATGHGLRVLCTHLIRVAASNNGRSQYGNRSGFYGLPNRGKETSRCQRCGHLGLPQHAEIRTFETIVLGHLEQFSISPSVCGMCTVGGAHTRRGRRSDPFGALPSRRTWPAFARCVSGVCAHTGGGDERARGLFPASRARCSITRFSVARRFSQREAWLWRSGVQGRRGCASDGWSSRSSAGADRPFPRLVDLVIAENWLEMGTVTGSRQLTRHSAMCNYDQYQLPPHDERNTRSAESDTNLRSNTAAAAGGPLAATPIAALSKIQLTCDAEPAPADPNFIVL
jgi:hypothetical protein